MIILFFMLRNFVFEARSVRAKSVNVSFTGRYSEAGLNSATYTHEFTEKVFYILGFHVILAISQLQ